MVRLRDAMTIGLVMLAAGAAPADNAVTVRGESNSAKRWPIERDSLSERWERSREPVPRAPEPRERAQQPVAVQRPVASGAERVPLEALVRQQARHVRVMQTLASVWSQHHETMMRVPR